MLRNLSKYKIVFILSICCLSAYASFGQKHDYNFLNRFSENSGGIQLTYSDDGDSLKVLPDYRNYTMTSGNPFSDRNGELLFFSNNLHVYNRDVEIIENGEDIAVGGFLPNLYSRDTTATFGVGQNWLTIPISDSLFYAFHKSAEISAYEFFDLDIYENGQRLSIYCDGLYLTKIRLSHTGKLYIKPDEKQILLVDDKLEHNQLTVCKHANGRDWWIHQPKVETSDAYLIRLYADETMDDPKLEYFSEHNGRVRSNSVTRTNPDGTVLARFIGLWGIDSLMHKIELFHFDRCTGGTERFFVDSLSLAPFNTRGKDIEFSSSGRFLYIANTSNILQLDLEDDNFFLNRDTIAVWDGFVLDNQPAFFEDMWRLPNGKIAINNRFRVPYLNYIHDPDKKGIDCDFEARALMSSIDSINPRFHLGIQWMPYFPEYRMEALDINCTTSMDTNIADELDVNVYPNPALDEINVDLRGEVEEVIVKVFSSTGALIYSVSTSSGRLKIPTYDYTRGMYYMTISSKKDAKQFSTKFIKI